jgi:hypothetical protein
MSRIIVGEFHQSNTDTEKHFSISETEKNVHLKKCTALVLRKNLQLNNLLIKNSIKLINNV